MYRMYPLADYEYRATCTALPFSLPSSLKWLDEANDPVTASFGNGHNIFCRQFAPPTRNRHSQWDGRGMEHKASPIVGNGPNNLSPPFSSRRDKRARMRTYIRIRDEADVLDQHGVECLHAADLAPEQLRSTEKRRHAGE